MRGQTILQVSTGGRLATGAECVYQALAKGYAVSTLVRDPARLITPPGSGGLAAGTAMKHPQLVVTQVRHAVVNSSASPFATNPSVARQLKETRCSLGVTPCLD